MIYDELDTASIFISSSLTANIHNFPFDPAAWITLGKNADAMIYRRYIITTAYERIASQSARTLFERTENKFCFALHPDYSLLDPKNKIVPLYFKYARNILVSSSLICEYFIIHCAFQIEDIEDIKEKRSARVSYRV